MAKKISTFSLESASSNESKACLFCLSFEEAEFKYGKMYRLNNVHVHYYCMLFASGLKQKGDSDEDGILGFLYEDILAEMRRGSRLRCVYCKKKGATVGCCMKYCRKVFHLNCGLASDSLHQFFGTFCSFCDAHRPLQLSNSSLMGSPKSSSAVCPICFVDVETQASFSTMRSPCCNNSWFHRSCIQKQAMNSGYFFKCPMCNNQEKFHEEMLTLGIYIPQQDASWEREENAYQDLLYRHNRCDAKICRCPEGRNFDKERTKWKVKLCEVCGSQGVHKECGSLSSVQRPWECPSCKEIIETVKQNKDSYLYEENYDCKIGRKSPKQIAKRRHQKGRTTKKITRIPSPTVNRAKQRVQNVSFSLGCGVSCKNFNQGGSVRLSLGNDAVIKVSMDDWLALTANAAKLQQKLLEEKDGRIGWMKLKNQYGKINGDSNYDGCFDRQGDADGMWNDITSEVNVLPMLNSDETEASDYLTGSLSNVDTNLLGDDERSVDMSVEFISSGNDDFSRTNHDERRRCDGKNSSDSMKTRPTARKSIKSNVSGGDISWAMRVADHAC